MFVEGSRNFTEHERDVSNAYTYLVLGWSHTNGDSGRNCFNVNKA